MTSAIESSDTVYTFSFTTDWFHTVHEVAPTRAPPSAAPYRAHRLATMPRSQRSATRNQKNPPARAGNRREQVDPHRIRLRQRKQPEDMGQDDEQRIARRVGNPE